MPLQLRPQLQIASSPFYSASLSPRRATTMTFAFQIKSLVCSFFFLFSMAAGKTPLPRTRIRPARHMLACDTAMLRCTHRAASRTLVQDAATLRRMSCASTQCHPAHCVLARDAHATPHLVCWHAMLRRCDAHATRHAALHVLARDAHAMPHLVCWHAMHTPRLTSCAGMQCPNAAMHMSHAMPHFVCWHAMPRCTSCAGMRCHSAPCVLACEATPNSARCWTLPL